MKQLIIMISTIVLGIFIAGIVLQFKDDAEELGKNTNDSLGSITQELKVTE